MRSKLGFTLVEIIIVVAIIGILAIGLIVAINPVEQVNRATDSTTFSLAREFTSATNQFQTNQQYSVACPDISCVPFLDLLNTTAPVALSTLTTVNTNMHSSGTSTSATNFTSHGRATEVWVTLTATSATKDAQFILCWQPESRLTKSDANVNNPNTTIYNNIGVPQSAVACPASNSNSCYRCLTQ